MKQILIIVMALFCLSNGRVASAQPPAQVPADVQKVLNDVADLDLLKALAPLKLTEDQIKKLLDIMKSAAALGEEKRKDDVAAWRSLAEVVTKARQEALTGKDIPAEVEARILKVLSDSEKRVQDLRKEGSSRIWSVARETLTATQKDEIEKQASKMLGGKRLVPREFKDNPAKAPKEAVQDLMLMVYIERILTSDRAIDVLGKIKPIPATPPTDPGAGESGTTKP
jgi:hypothetical protein